MYIKRNLITISLFIYLLFLYTLIDCIFNLSNTNYDFTQELFNPRNSNASYVIAGIRV